MSMININKCNLKQLYCVTADGYNARAMIHMYMVYCIILQLVAIKMARQYNLL